MLESPALIAAKARDILRHYVATVLPEGLKAQVAATSRKAAVAYQAALAEAHQELIAQLEALTPEQRARDDAALQQDEDLRFLVTAHTQLDIIKRLEFVAIISGNHNDGPAFKHWSDPGKKDAWIARFKKPLIHADSAGADGLAFICVKNMLLTGFDAPLEGVLYLDRFMQGHELLQAIARVNRTAQGKSVGLVVDYIGIGKRLKEALDVYTSEDVQGVLLSIDDELPLLDARHRRVMEHAARYHITTHLDEDPVYYKGLSKRLEQILARFDENWEELVQALLAFTADVRQGRPADATGLDARTEAPFLSILAEATGRMDAPMEPDRLSTLVTATVAVVQLIREEVRRVDFWRNAHAQNMLRARIIRYLDDHDVAPFAQQEQIADSMVDLARTLHARLIA